jgi:hypothetical protein
VAKTAIRIMGPCQPKRRGTRPSRSDHSGNFAALGHISTERSDDQHQLSGQPGGGFWVGVPNASKSAWLHFCSFAKRSARGVKQKRGPAGAPMISARREVTIFGGKEEPVVGESGRSFGPPG